MHYHGERLGRARFDPLQRCTRLTVGVTVALRQCGPATIRQGRTWPWIGQGDRQAWEALWRGGTYQRGGKCLEVVALGGSWFAIVRYSAEEEPGWQL